MREPFGVILAGGRGMRMGGLNKAELVLGHSRLLDLCTARLEPQVERLVVTTNTNVATNLPWIKDMPTGHLGPLAGVLAGMDWAAHHGGTHIVTVAVDTPFFPCDLVPQLLLAGDGSLAVATTADGPHDTFSLWPVDLRETLRIFLSDEGSNMRAFMDAHNAQQAIFSTTTPSSFFDINTANDLRNALEWI